MPSAADSRPAGDVAPVRTTRVAVAALALVAVIDVLGTVLAVGHYEHRITVVTHSDADVLPAWFVYTLLDQVVPYGAVTTVAARSWVLGLLAAGIAVAIWLVLARRTAERRWWAGAVATVLLKLLAALYAVLTSSGGTLEGTALDTRPVAYPLWIAGTVVLVLAVARSLSRPTTSVRPTSIRP